MRRDGAHARAFPAGPRHGGPGGPGRRAGDGRRLRRERELHPGRARAPHPVPERGPGRRASGHERRGAVDRRGRGRGAAGAAPRPHRRALRRLPDPRRPRQRARDARLRLVRPHPRGGRPPDPPCAGVRKTDRPVGGPGAAHGLARARRGARAAGDRPRRRSAARMRHLRPPAPGRGDGPVRRGGGAGDRLRPQDCEERARRPRADGGAHPLPPRRRRGRAAGAALGHGHDAQRPAALHALAARSLGRRSLGLGRGAGRRFRARTRPNSLRARRRTRSWRKGWSSEPHRPDCARGRARSQSEVGQPTAPRPARPRARGRRARRGRSGRRGPSRRARRDGAG